MKKELREKFAGYRAGKTLKGTKTQENLLKAFAGESQARNRYVMFAQKAREDGYGQIAAIFEETAHNEQVHAQTFFAFLEGGPLEITATYPAGIVAETYDNLLAAASGEYEEFEEIYPHFADIAEKEGFPKIGAQFRMIAKIEKEHGDRYRKLAVNVKDGKIFVKDEETVWICRECGHIHIGKQAPAFCPACQNSKDVFQVKESNYK
ncbi:MAG: rubrerythrin family protein [Candidatus Omnitrophica bacterium]|nr:rubrerythrin family protein [Candidatus Omnitrophota bacterium]